MKAPLHYFGFSTSPKRNLSLIRKPMFLSALFLSAISSNAQTMGYSFASAAGTYSAISGGTVHSSGSAMDDATFSVTLPFTFNFNGTNYTQVYVSENGYISFGSTDPGSSTRSAVSSTNTGFQVATAFSADLQGISGTSELRSQVTGSAPNRTFIAQWTNLQFYLGSGQSFNFQVQLDEANGVVAGQVVRIRYGTVSNTGSGTAQVGLRGTTNATYMNRTTSSNWASTAAGTTNADACTISSTVAPASGLTFTWTPLPPVYASSTTTQSLTQVVNTNVTNQQIIGVQVVVSGGAGGTLNLTQLNLSTNGSTSAANISNARVFYTGTSSTFSTTTQFGSTVSSPSGAFNVTGTQALSLGTNYFWLAYDIASGATLGNVVDGECTQITVGGSPYTPSVTAPAGSRSIYNPLSGTYTVGSTGAFATLTAAVAALNAAGVSGPVIFSLTDALYSTNETFPITINQFSGTSPTNTLTIKPATGISPAIEGSTTSGILTLNGADNIVIDGSNAGSTSRDLTIVNGNGSGADIWVKSLGTGAGARNVTIKNCNIQRSSSGLAYAGIYAGGASIAYSSGAGGADNDLLTITNNDVKQAFFGIACLGAASSGMLDTLVISNNTIGSTSYMCFGILLFNATLSHISGNTISNMVVPTTNGPTAIQISPFGTMATCHIYGNKISGLRNQSTGGYPAIGINVEGTLGTLNMYNNDISDLSSYSTGWNTTYNTYGIRLVAGGTYNVYYNSVNLYGPGLNSSGTNSACLLVTGGTSINLRNNTFVNTQTGGLNSLYYAIYSGISPSVFTTTSNNNNYYVTGSYGVLGNIGATDRTTITAWKAAMGTQRDSISISANPLFNANTLQRPTATSPLLGTGLPVAGITTDFRGVTRSGTAPTIGAYEQGGDFWPPTVSVTPLAATAALTNRTTASFATITDASGISIAAGTKPRLYYKKSTDANAYVGNTSADNGWKWVESSSTTSPFDFTINYALLTGATVAGGDVIQYFVVAQDSASTPNVSVNPGVSLLTAPSTVALNSTHFPASGYGSYSILYQVSGTVLVGTGQTYTSLTGAGGLFSYINSNVVSGNITALITSDITETGAVALNQTTEFGGGNFKITVSPNAATNRTLTGAYVGGLIRLSGADRITFDGSFGGTGKYLTFQNTQASGTTGCIQLISLGNAQGAVKNTIRNCNFIMPRTGVTSGAIFAGGPTINTAGSDNDSLLVLDNYVRSATVGIVVSGNVGFECDSVSIAGNTFDTMSQASVSLSNIRSLTFRVNGVNNIIGATGVALAGVNLVSNVRNADLTLNSISNILALDQNAYGIIIGLSDSNILVSRNIIRRVLHTGTSGWGGKGIDINTGLAASAITIVNNMVTGVSGDGWSSIGNDANVGLRINGGGGIRVYHNTVNMYGNIARSAATGDLSAAFAITSVAGANIDVRNNIFRNSIVNTTGTQTSYAIFLAGATLANISNLAYNNYYAAGSQAMMGFYNAPRAGMVSWKAGTVIDSLSQSNAVSFIDSTSNLRLTGASLGNYYLRGLTLAGYTTDFDNANRNSYASYMGMHEGSPTLAMSANAGSDKAICAGVSVQIGSGSIVTGGIAPYTYSWSPTATAVSNPVVSPTTTSTYYVAVRDTFGFTTVDTVVVNVTPGIAGNSATANQTICSGSTPASLAGSAPTGGTGTYVYSWLRSTTSATTAFSTATGTVTNQNYSPTALTTTTYFRRYVTSGACADTSAAVTITVTPAIAGNSATADQTVCSGSTPASLAGSAPTGGTGTYVYSWLKSTTSATTAFSTATGTVTNQNYAPPALTSTTYFRRYVTSGVCTDTSSAVTITVNPVITSNTASGGSTICNTNSTSLTGSAPAGGNSSYTFLWQASTTGATSGFATATGTNNTQNYTSGSLSTATWFRRVVNSGACVDTSTTTQVTITNTNAWTGTTSTAWGTPSNWGCGRVPIATDNVTISLLPLNPVISDGGRVVGSITINSSGALTMNNPASQLTILQGFTINSGTLYANLGEIVFGGTAPQGIPGGPYNRIVITNPSGAYLGGMLQMNDNLVMSGGNLLLYGQNVYMLGSTAAIIGASSSRYIVTNGTGVLDIANIGSGGRTGAVVFPVGNSSYNPVTVTNSGTQNNFTVRVIDSVTNTYSGSTPTGARITSNAVNRTWFVNKYSAGGNATVSVQWNTADELAGFTRATSYLARHNGTTWLSNTASAASGSGPWTQTRTGITSFSPFGVGSGGTLPVELTYFSASRLRNAALLTWETASEINVDRFDVERSVKGSPFEYVASVKGKGTSNALTTYTLTDEHASQAVKTAGSDVIYYRLKQVDRDGSFSYSALEKVYMSDATLKAEVLPNPYTTSAGLTVQTSASGYCEIVVTDVKGSVIATQPAHLTAGSNSVEIPGAGSFAAGMYFVHVRVADECVVLKLVRQD